MGSEVMKRVALILRAFNVPITLFSAELSAQAFEVDGPIKSDPIL